LKKMREVHYDNYLKILSYFREIGREFSERHPRHAYFVAEEGGDPDTQRLIEGFAFLTAQLHQRLDDRLPELTYTLIDALCPHYLKPIPCATVVEFESKQMRRGEHQIPQGTELTSIPIAKTPCRFSTSYVVDVQPIRLTSVMHTEATLCLKFQLLEGTQFEDLSLKSLRLHLHGAPRYALYLWLCQHLKQVKLRGDTDSQEIVLASGCVVPIGFDEPLLPYTTHAFGGPGILTEYFAFPEKFMFLDVLGLTVARELPVESEFELVFEFDTPLVRPSFVDENNIRINCTPAVNLCRSSAKPIEVDQTRREYPIIVDEPVPTHYEIYAVNSINAWEQETLKVRPYEPFYDFAHGFSPSHNRVYYQTRLNERPHPIISLTSSEKSMPSVDVAILELICTNGRLAERLRLGDIHGEVADAAYRNIGTVSGQVRIPPDELHWRLIAHLLGNSRATLTLERLKTVLNLHNFHPPNTQTGDENQRRIASIANLSIGPATRLFRGTPIHGQSIEVTLESDGFAGEGDRFLFANLLNRYISRTATINTFSQLIIRDETAGETYECPPIIEEKTFHTSFSS
jgi:type VI secretion system protein ImpG